MEYWEKDIECMSRDDIAQLQLEKLQATLNRVYKNVNHYRKLFRDIDFMPEDLKSIADISSLPLTTRQDLIDNYPYGMFAVPLREVVRLHSPALSLDNPLVTGFTQNDLKNWAQLMARNLTAIGVTKDDVVQISLTFGILTGPFGVQLGAEQIGASVIPMSSGQFASQVKIMRDFRTTVLVSSPTVALNIIRTMADLRIDPKSLALKNGLFGAEPWSQTTRQRIENALGITATDTYGLTEVFGPGVAWECMQKNGLHISEDHFLPEIIDPKTLTPLSPGQEGELVITTLAKEAFPLVRFRTGDITRIDYEPCACGRTHCRISRIYKRSDDVFIMKGKSIIPKQIGQILNQLYEGCEGCPNYQLVVERIEDQDVLTVLVEVSDQYFFDTMKKQRVFIDALHKKVSEFLGWEVRIKMVESGTFDSEKIVVDHRKFD